MKFIVFVALIVQVSANNYYVELSNNGPVIVGANITFTAKLFMNEGERPTGTFKYKWRDNVFPQHEKTDANEEDVSNWTIPYEPSKYKAGTYQVEVIVYSTVILIDWPICGQRSGFNLTDLLNGKMEIIQHNKTIDRDYISSAEETTHLIELSQPDKDYLKKTSTVVFTYWYLDCMYMGKSENYTFVYKYKEMDKSHHISALVVAAHDHADNKSVMQTQNESVETSTEIYLVNTTKPTDIKSNDIVESGNNTKFSYSTVYNSDTGNLTESDLLFDCPSGKLLGKLENTSWGVFSRRVIVKAPVAGVKFEGNNWLKQGDLLNLTIACNGSAPFRYCVKFVNGIYNTTGNETCNYERVSDVCYITVQHYVKTSYTVLLIIQNDINKVVTGIGVNIYEVTKKDQLSVIIVPVTASIAAVILIVFGIAYYIQSRNRFFVEVADFDFSNASDMEYKTFRERLVEAVSNAFNKTEDYSEQDSSNGVPASKKYGSMQ